MSELPLVTVAIVTHQFEEFIERAIDSALAMDWPADRLDVLVIDDGSTDATPSLVAAYGDRVRYVHKPNEGVVASVSLSFAMARGEYIAPLAGDDECLPDRLRRQVAAMEARPEVGMLYSDMELIDAASQTIAPSFAVAMKMTPLVGRCLGALLTRNTVSGGPALIRSSMLEHVLPMPPEAVWEDWWTALKVAEVAEIAYQHVPVYRYRHHGRNMNLGASPERAIQLAREELPFRRWMLGGNAVSFDSVGADELLLAWRTFDGQTKHVADKLGCWLEDLVAVSDEDRAAADVAFAAGDCIRALSCDPAHSEARAALGVAEIPHAPLTARSEVTLVLLDDLVAEPALFGAYAARVDADDDATLVIYAPGADGLEAQARLLGAVPDVIANDAPDVLLHAVPRSWAGEHALRERASALLERRTVAA